MSARIEDYALIGDLYTAALDFARRLHRLDVRPAFRLRGLFRRPARHARQRPLADRPARRRPGHAPPIPRRHACPRNRTRNRRRHGRRHRLHARADGYAGRAARRRGPTRPHGDAYGTHHPLTITAPSCRGCSASTTPAFPPLPVLIGWYSARRSPRQQGLQDHRRVHRGRGRASGLLADLALVAPTASGAGRLRARRRGDGKVVARVVRPLQVSGAVA